MTPRNLFNIILKILGVLFIKDFLALLPQLLSVGLFLTRADSITEAIWTLVGTLLMLLIYGLVSYYLIFKTEYVIDKLKLDRGFDQEIFTFHIHRSTVIGVSVIIIGGYMVVDEIPNFCGLLFRYFQEKRLTYGATHPNISYTLVSAVKIGIGLLLMIHQRFIVNMVEKLRKN